MDTTTSLVGTEKAIFGCEGSGGFHRVRPVVEGRRWELEIGWLGRPVSANVWYGKHRMAKAQLVKKWREAGAEAALVAGLPRGLAGFRLVVQARYARNQLTDFDSMAPTGKAVCDGLVDYGLVPEDDPRFVHGMLLLPSFHDRQAGDALLLTVIEVTPVEESQGLLL